MKIYIDISVLTLATFVTGIQRVTIEVAARLIGAEDMEIVLLHYNAAHNVYYRIDNRAFTDYYVQHKGIKEKMITKTEVPLSEMGRGTVFFDVDAVWMSRMKRSYLLPALKEQGTRIVAHIHDIISITHPQYCMERGVYNFMDYIGAHLQYADELTVSAQATVKELEKLAAQVQCELPPCRVVPLGADFRGDKKVTEADVPPEVAAAATGPFILMVGTIEPRKNHKLVLEAYDRGLKEMGYHVIFAGYMGWNMERFAEQFHGHPDFGKGIYHFEGLDDNAVSYLYQKAKFLAFCSYTEGFGLPIIEAIQRGTPVIASDIPVSREVAGEYAIWFPQDNVEEFCEKVREYDRDESRYLACRDRLKKDKAPTWDETLDKVRDVLTSVV